MKYQPIHVAAALALTALFCACSGGKEGEEPTEKVPTPEEAASEAAQEINDTNADEEFERLKQEIEQGG